MEREGISDEARRFITQSDTATWVPVDLSPQGVAELRAETSECARPVCEAVQRVLGTTLSHDQVANVPVQWVIPQYVSGQEERLPKL